MNGVKPGFIAIVLSIYSVSRSAYEVLTFTYCRQI